MKEAVLSVRMSQGPVCEVLRHSSGYAHLLDFRVATRGRGYHHFIEVNTPSRDAVDVIDEIRASPAIEELEVAKLERDRALAMVISTGCPMCKTINGSGCFVMGAFSRTSEEVEWRLLMGQEEPLKKLIDDLSSLGLAVTVTEVRRVTRSQRLTARQEELLRVAYEMGYFEYPRRVGLRRLAKLLNIAPASLAETLRRGERNVVEGYLSSRRKV